MLARHISRPHIQRTLLTLAQPPHTHPTAWRLLRVPCRHASPHSIVHSPQPHPSKETPRACCNTHLAARAACLPRRTPLPCAAHTLLCTHAADPVHCVHACLPGHNTHQPLLHSYTSQLLQLPAPTAASCKWLPCKVKPSYILCMELHPVHGLHLIAA